MEADRLKKATVGKAYFCTSWLENGVNSPIGMKR